MKHIKLLPLTLAIALASCGGSGGVSTNEGQSSQNVPTAGVSGVVIDGYLSNATVFLDLNDNGVYDAGEPTTVTNSNGAYTLDASADQVANHSIIVSVEAGTAIDQDNSLVTVSDSYHLTAPKGMTTITPLTTHIKSKINGGANLASATQDLQQQLGLTGSDVTSDYIASPNIDAHKIAAAVVPVLQAVKAKKDDTPSMTYADSQALIDSSVQTFISNRANTIKSKVTVSAAASEVSNLVMKRIPTLTCVAPIKNTSSGSAPGNYVFAINPSGGGTFGGTFTVPANKTQLSQLRLNVNDQQVATNFQISIFQGAAVSGTPIYTSDVIYFLNPNTNPRNASGGFRDTTFNVNATVISGQKYFIQVIGGGRVGTISGNYEVGVVVADDPGNPNPIYLGGSPFGNYVLSADFCYN